jgi:Beta protein
MVLENKSYVPTLAIRPSEMNGLERLPSLTKDRMTPCFLLAPWANSSTLEKTIIRIENAFPKRSYFLDIDRDYQLTNTESQPQQDLVNLMDPSNYYANWLSFVEKNKRIMPCVQSRGQTQSDISEQIRRYQKLGRTYCMRIVRERFPENIDEIVQAFATSGAADFAIILEGGWTTDPLSLAVWFDGVISSSLNAIDATIPIVLSCTSIPKMFTQFNGLKPTLITFSNRSLVSQVARNTNRQRVIYGDWGSTRPRENSGIASRPLDRVDYPTSNAWCFARNKNAEWSFHDAAIAILNSEEWDGSLGIWGEEMIKDTAINQELGIDTPHKNVAVRVNIHLHRQAFFDTPIFPMQLDENWED